MAALTPAAGLSLHWEQASRPCAGHFVSGDRLLVRAQADRLDLALIDVAGHGREAFALAEALAAPLEDQLRGDPAATLRWLHGHLQRSRGASVGLLSLDPIARRLLWCAIGNVTLRLAGGRTLLTRPGQAGTWLPTCTNEVADLLPGQAWVLFTDGLRSAAGADPLPRGAPADQARALLADHARSHDDATVVVLQVQA